MDKLTVWHGMLAGAALMSGVGFLIMFGLWLVRPWLRAFLSGCPISVFWLIGARLRGTPVNMLIDALAARRWQEKQTSIQQIEVCYIQNKARIVDLQSLLDALARMDEQRVT